MGRSFFAAATVFVISTIASTAVHAECFIITSQEEWNLMSDLNKTFAEMDWDRGECPQQIKEQHIPAIQPWLNTQQATAVSERGFDPNKTWTYSCPDGTAYKFNFDNAQIDSPGIVSRYHVDWNQRLGLMNILDYQIALETNASTRTQLKQNRFEILMDIFQSIQNSVIGHPVVQGNGE